MTRSSAEKMTHLSLQTSRGRSPVQDGLSAAVQVVKLLLGHWVVYVHGGHAEFPSFGQLIQPGEKRAGGLSAPLLCGCMPLSGRNSPVNPSDTLLYDAPDLLEYIWVFLVHPVCQVTSIIKDLTGKKDANGWKGEQISHVGDIYSTHYYHVGLPALSVDTAINAPPEIILRLPFPGKHRHAWNIAHLTSEFDIQRSFYPTTSGTTALQHPQNSWGMPAISDESEAEAPRDPAVTSQWKCSTFKDIHPNATLHHRVANHQRWLLLQLIKHLQPASRSDSESCQLFGHLPLPKTQMSPVLLF